MTYLWISFPLTPAVFSVTISLLISTSTRGQTGGTETVRLFIISTSCQGWQQWLKWDFWLSRDSTLEYSTLICITIGKWELTLLHSKVWFLLYFSVFFFFNFNNQNRVTKQKYKFKQKNISPLITTLTPQSYILR